MENLCSKDPDDYKELRRRLVVFLNNRSLDAVTGFRRMGRSNLVNLTASIADVIGKSCSIYPDTSGSDIILFDDWGDMEDVIGSLLSDRPETEIIYGQDLCHQVPVIVRFRKKG